MSKYIECPHCGHKIFSRTVYANQRGRLLSDKDVFVSFGKLEFQDEVNEILYICEGCGTELKDHCDDTTCHEEEL